MITNPNLHYCKCGEPATRQETFYRGINEYRHSYQEWICDECYDRLDEEELSRCCGAPPDPMFPDDKVCDVCKEHF